MSRFDVVVFGATSFVGRLVAKHILETHGVGQGLSWAIAGRSPARLAALKDSLGGAAADVQVLIADADQLDQLKAMCLQTKVVITTAGPFARYGDKLVQACAETGTDYCDITGEVPWVAEMIKRFEPTAKQSGARIVSFCGFDSIPSDLGVHHLQREAQRRYGATCTNVRMRVFHARGNPPGGTYATVMDAIEEATRSKAFRAALANPYVLCPPGHGFVLKQREARSPAYDADHRQWSAMFVMGGINTRVVHRSHALLGAPYGRAFRYEEAMLVGPGLLGRLAAYAVTLGLVSFVTLAAMPVTRSLLRRFAIPKPGEGSSLKGLSRCSFDIRLTGETDGSEQVRVRLAGQGDPACFATSRMLAESGICLATELSKADAPGGFWTPASLLGDKLIDRLNRYAQMKFDVVT